MVGRTCLGVVDAGNIVHTTCNEVHTVRRPSEIVDLRTYGSAHCADPPCLLIFQAFLEVVCIRLVLSWHPQQYVAVVASAGKYLAFSILVCVTVVLPCSNTHLVDSI